MRRKILIATPIKLGLGSDYMAGFVDTMRTQFPNVDVEFAVLEGPAVNLARNELAGYALEIKARELVFIDADIKWTAAHFARLISHVDLDIVGGIYCKKKPGRPFWLMNPKPGGIAEGDVCEVDDIATGFMKIRVDTVFPAMQRKFPDLEFTSQPPRPGTAWEFFPMGISGPRAPRERLDRVKEALKMLPSPQNPVETDREWKERLWAFAKAVDRACHDEQPPGLLRGEDYNFCHLARACGFKVYADFGMAILPHVGNVAYPITPDMVGVSGDLVPQPEPSGKVFHETS